MISLLLGRDAGAIARGAASTTSYLPAGIPAGLASDLLERRPDVLRPSRCWCGQRERRRRDGELLSDDQPDGRVRRGGTTVSDLFATGKTWSIGAGLTGADLPGGRLTNRTTPAVAQWERARVGYEKTVTNALTEVSAVVGAYDKLGRR